MLQKLIGNRYKLKQKIAVGPFYEVFKGVHHHNQTAVAIKIEKRTVSESKLFNQVKIIRDIQGEDLTADYGFPTILENANEGTYNYLAMELLGPSIDRILVEKQGKLESSFAMQLGQQMIDRVQTLHSRGYVHRDLRPDHFLYGRAKKPTRLYLSGFTMGRRYLWMNKRHSEYRDTKQSFTGTARYLSVNAHMGIQQSRRDDIESIIYILIYLMRGSLPWQKLKARDKIDKFDKIFECKITTPIQQICKEVPPIFKDLLYYVRMLEYESEPDYQYMRRSLRGEKVQIEERKEQNVIFVEQQTL